MVHWLLWLLINWKNWHIKKIQISSLFIINCLGFLTLYSSLPCLASERSLSLAESINMALRSNVSMRNALIDEHIQQRQKNLYLAAMMPQIHFNLNATYYTNIPERFIPDFITPITAKFLADFGVVNSSGQPIQPINYNPSKGFFTKMNTNWNIFQDFLIQQILFEPDIFIAISSIKALHEMAQANVQATKEQITLNTAKAYFTLVILKKRLIAANSLLKYTQAIHHELQTLKIQGFQDEKALIQMQLNLNKVSNLHSKLKQALGNAERNFAYLIDLDNLNNKPAYKPEAPILSSDFPLEKLENIPIDLERNFEQRADRKQLQTLLKLKKLAILQKKISYLPRINLFGNLGYMNLSNDFQLTTFGSSKGFRNDFVGLKLNLSIFEGLKKHHELKIAQLEYDKVYNNLTNSDKGLELEVENALQQSFSSLEYLQRFADNLQLSSKLYTTLLAKRKLGMSSSIELLNAKIQIAEYEDSYLAGFLDAIYARLNLHKALGNLEKLLSELN